MTRQRTAALLTAKTAPYKTAKVQLAAYCVLYYTKEDWKAPAAEYPLKDCHLEATSDSKGVQDYNTFKVYKKEFSYENLTSF